MSLKGQRHEIVDPFFIYLNYSIWVSDMHAKTVFNSFLILRRYSLKYKTQRIHIISGVVIPRNIHICGVVIPRIIRIRRVMTTRMRIICGITTLPMRIFLGITTPRIICIHRVSYFSEYLRELKKELKTVLACISGTQME